MYEQLSSNLTLNLGYVQILVLSVVLIVHSYLVIGFRAGCVVMVTCQSELDLVAFTE